MLIKQRDILNSANKEGHFTDSMHSIKMYRIERYLVLFFRDL